jgi:hypothetical protein
MDHLLRPRNPAQTPLIEVPCLGMNRYDGQKLEGYPDRQGWGPRPLREWEALFRKPTQKLLAFFQTWLFFGLIESFFGEPINPNDFVRETGALKHRVITTARLLPMLESWTRSVSTSRNSGPESWQIMADLALSTRINMLWGREMGPLGKMSRHSNHDFSLVDYITTGHAIDCRDPRVAFSMAVLTETLMDTAYVYSSGTKEFLNTLSIKAVGYPWRNVILREMRQQGWCPADLAMMHQRLSLAGISYMSHIERPGKAKIHRMIRTRPMISSMSVRQGADDSAGELCSMSTCSSRLLHEDSYTTKHVEGCSGCYDMVADYDEILSILRGGSIPLILSIDPEDDSATIKLVESEPSFSYVAISHVWSDGLGNPQTSALPRCQLLRLSNLIRHLPGQGADMLLFWMDTICCPPDSAGQNEAQDLAISMMRKTYEEATVVLVLDSWLLEQNIEKMPDEEVLMRIVCSGWNSRLWTLQEGALASSLFFQFSNAAYDVDKGLNRLLNVQSTSLGVSLKSTIIQRIHEFRGFRKIENDISVRLFALANALKFRSTSVASDEPLCLSALLGFDTRVFINVPPEDRMRIFWDHFKSIPYMLIVFPFPRLKAGGAAWAPQSFLSPKRDLVPGGASPMLRRLLTTPKAEVRCEGVFTQTAGIIFSTERCFLGEGLHLVVGETCYSFHLNLREADDATLDISSEGYHVETPKYKFNLWDSYGTTDAAFIFTRFPKNMIEIMQKTGATATAGLGVLVSIERQAHGAIHTKRVCFGHDAGRGPASTVTKEISARPGFLPVSNTLLGPSCITSGQLTSWEQNWYVN